MQDSQDTIFVDSGPTKSRWTRRCLTLLAMLIAGCGLAYHFWGPGTYVPPTTDYETLNQAQAEANEQLAKEQVDQDQAALTAAREALATAQSDWEAANQTKQKAEKQLATATQEQQAQAQQELSEAQSHFDRAAKRLEEAQEDLKAAENKLKSADQLLAEAEAERERIAKLVAQETAYRKALLGKWTRPDYYGQIELELREDGKGLMVIQFEGKYTFLVAKSLEVDIDWEVTGGDHFISTSLRGRPESAYKWVTGFKGTRRDQVLVEIDDHIFTTHEADDKSKTKTWKRIGEK